MSFLITIVYGPMCHNRKSAFLRKLRRLKPFVGQRWLVLGDLNLIYRAHDKNNRKLNLRSMRLFSLRLTSVSYMSCTFRIEDSLGVVNIINQLRSSWTECFVMRVETSLSSHMVFKL